MEIALMTRRPVSGHWKVSRVNYWNFNLSAGTHASVTLEFGVDSIFILRTRMRLLLACCFCGII